LVYRSIFRWHCVTQWAVCFIRGSLWFGSSREQLSAPSVICSVSVGKQCSTSWCGILSYSNVCFCMTPMWNVDLLESVSYNFGINFMMKEFPADKQFAISWINLELWDSQQRRNENLSEKEKVNDIWARLELTSRKSLKTFSSGDWSVKVQCKNSNRIPEA
jgi:hypothetical protein